MLICDDTLDYVCHWRSLARRFVPLYRVMYRNISTPNPKKLNVSFCPAVIAAQLIVSNQFTS